jgi:hypothetical protein
MNRVGRGALGKIGKYHYPLRLVKRLGNKRWKVRWWPHASFPGGVIPEDVVEEHLIVDELWQDPSARREIRVSY